MTNLISSLIIDPFVRLSNRILVVNERKDQDSPQPLAHLQPLPLALALALAHVKRNTAPADSHARNLGHVQTARSKLNGHRKSAVVGLHTDEDDVDDDDAACLVTTSSNQYSYSFGGDGQFDSGPSSRETTVTDIPVPPGSHSDASPVPAESATPAPNTEQAILSPTPAASPMNPSDDMAATGLHSRPEHVDIPPTRPRLQETSLPRPTLPDHAKMSSSLPADDGMRLLRERIHEIRSDSLSQEDKARKMHDLMTEEWKNAQLNTRPQSPASQPPQERPFDPASPRSTLYSPASPSTASAVPANPQNPFNIHPADLQPTYRPLPEPEPVADDGHADESPTEPSESVLGCKHYQRNVKIQCFDCKTWHTCRHCHDAAVHSHHLNRRATENMLCMHCFTPQAAGQYCKNCNERAAWYYCHICKLWDDDGSKRIYHCADCGICRKGEGLGKDYVHCKKCNVCVSISHFPTHTCIENATDSNCPLCLDYMFTSPLEIVAMPCGHYLHHHCYTSLMLSTYQCPICKRSAVNMETQWRKLEEEIRHQPMPPEWAGVRVEVRCNDCAGKTIVPYHWLGCKCNRCDSFNTVEAGILANEEVQRSVEDFAERRREIREEELRNRRPWTAPSEDQTYQHHHQHHQPLRTRVVRPYFLDMEERDGVAVRPEHRRADSVGQFGEVPVAAPGEGWAAQQWVNGVREGWVGNVGGAWGGIGGRAEVWVGGVRDGFGLPGLPNLPNLNPWEMLGRVGRGLEPIRHYFDGEIVDGVPEAFLRAARLERERLGDRWGAEDEAEAEEEEGSDSEYEDESGSEEEENDEHEHIDELEGKTIEVVTTPPISGGKKGMGEPSGVRELNSGLPK
ncbi:zf-CHY-domain-containing protein [Venturia nashicola]|uniref:Zf-CHY-domain-containing protein n=1 Tax=Venturia nashicola TaxID=86259 RepID=A0A4Z1NJ71_9PEZI|nr:zf-CHY-domain-containing protein [Venturia nashicola]TLD22590.1 zf-CHY-domain-containing protein [Venturia nashicola]